MSSFLTISFYFGLQMNYEQFPLLNAIKFLMNENFLISHLCHEQANILKASNFLGNCFPRTTRFFFINFQVNFSFFTFTEKLFHFHITLTERSRITFVGKLAAICVSIWEFLPIYCILWIGLNWLWDGCVEEIFHLLKIHFRCRLNEYKIV